MFLSRIRLAGLLPAAALILFFLACHLDSSSGNVYMDVAGDASWLQYDTVIVVLKGSDGKTDTLFNGHVNSLSDLKKLRAQGYDGGLADIEVTGRKGGQTVFREVRKYDGSKQATASKDTLIRPVPPGSKLELHPDDVVLFLGGPDTTLMPYPTDAWKGKTLLWKSNEIKVATVDAKGTVTATGIGAAYIRASANDTLSAQARVQVVRDVPVVDAGEADTAVQPGANLTFTIKVSQAYGWIEYFAWDLDGDGKPDDSLKNIPKDQTVFTTPARTYTDLATTPLSFYVRDGEGNSATAGKRLKVTDNVPAIDSISAKPSLISIQDPVVFSAHAKELGGGRLGKFAWDYDDDGTPDDSGSLSASAASIPGNHLYPKAGVFKARLRVTDSAGTPVTAQVSVDVRQDMPVAVAGPDVSVEPGAIIRLHGTAHDTLGRIVRLEWKIGASEYTATTGDTSFKAGDAAGNLVCVLSALDDDGQVASDTVTITIAATGAPAISGLNDDVVITIKDTVVFKGKADSRGAALKSFSWDFDGDGKADAVNAISGSSASLAEKFRYVSENVYNATVKVEDEAGKTATAGFKVTVKLDAPSANAGADLISKASAKVDLHGIAKDTLGKIVKQEWKVGAADYVAAPNGDLSFTAPDSGTQVTCVFRATDDDDLTATDTLKLTVNDLKAPVLSNVTAAATLTIQDVLAMSAKVDAGDAALKSFSWDFDNDGNADSTGTVTGTSATVATSHRFPAAGIFTVLLKIIDEAGKKGSAQILVTVKQDKPKADAGADVNVVAGGQVSLHATAKDSLGTITKREWKIGTGLYAVTAKNDTAFTAPALPGLLTCEFKVTDDDGQTDEDTVQVFVAASSDATLSDLKPSTGTLSPGFASADTVYSFSVPNATATIAFTPTLSNTGASVKVNNATVASGQASANIALAVGSNPIKTIVTAQDGSTKRTYLVTVSRAGSGNADLSGLTPSVGSLSPAFVPGTTAYTMSLSNATASLTFTPVTASATATVKVNGKLVVSTNPSDAIALVVGVNNVAISVTAEDGTVKPYSIAVTRQSNDATLSSLTLSAGPVSPSFDPTVGSYSVAAPNLPGTTTVTPTAAGIGAVIKVNGTTVPTGTASGAIALVVGANVITIAVTAQDGTPKSYSVTVTRALSSNADLSDLHVKRGALVGTFGAATLEYTVVNANNQVRDSIFATVADAGATLKVNGTAMPSGSSRETDTLKLGPTSQTVAVTAADGTVKTYTINFYREGPSAIRLGYAWSNSIDTGASSAVTLTTYVYNSSGGIVTLNRINRGRYDVSFAGLGANSLIENGGHADVTAYGSQAGAYCKDRGSSGLGVDFTSTIYCYDAAGSSIDIPFTVVLRLPTAKANGNSAYAFFDQPTTASYTPSNLWAYNTDHGKISVDRASTGNYTVRFKETYAAGRKYHVKPTANYLGNERCETDGPSSSGTDFVSTVHCYGPTGTPADTKFSVDVVQPFAAGVAIGQGWAIANGIGATPVTLNDANAYNSAGGTITAVRNATGTYSVTFAGLGSANARPGNVQVTAFGGTGSCKVSSWSAGGTDFIAGVNCYSAAGVAADGAFAIWALK